MSYDVKIPKLEYQAVLHGVRRGMEICNEMARLRFMLRAISVRFQTSDRAEIDRAVKMCEQVARLRVDLTALERRLMEADQNLTPVRPPSADDIKAAFANASDFEGKK